MNETASPSPVAYQVVRNGEDQYSIWPAGRELPRGWNAVAFSGSKDECLAYIRDAWTDMRPLSLRREMDETGGRR